jgi:hypothetical protein
MSFGKDPSARAAVKNFRQGAAIINSTGRRPRGSGGGGKSWLQFKDRFRPSMSPISDTFRLIPGAYTNVRVDWNSQGPDGKPLKMEVVLPFWTYTEHFDGRLEVGSVCSAGPYGQNKDLREPCRGHDIFFETMDRSSGKAKRGNRMSMREMYAMTVLHYAPYAKVPSVDKRTGQVRANDKGEAYMEWRRVLPHERDQFAQFEQMNAHVLHWPMGYAHYNTLFEHEKVIQDSCVGCGGRGTIRSLYLICGNPQCGEVIVEDPKNSSIPVADLDNMQLQPVKCPRCNIASMVDEAIACKLCSRPIRATLYDVDLQATRIKVSQGDSESTVLSIQDYSNPYPISPDFAEMAVPMPLNEIWAPTPWDKQLEQWPLGA